MAWIRYITHMICGRCGKDVEVDSHKDERIITLTEYSSGKYLNFNCPHCQVVYPLPFTKLPF